MNGVNFVSSVGIAMVPPTWEVVGTPDLNEDAKPDFLWRHKTTGELAAWYMNGVNFISSVGIAMITPIWELVASPLAGYIAKYSQDFSSEPGWATNNGSRFYRDPITNTFLATTVEGANEYATIPVSWTGNSFKMEFDIKIATTQLASGISVGLFDSDRNDSQPNVVDVIYGNSDDGLHVNLHAANSITSKGAPSTIQNVQTNIWYHNVITWNKDTGIVTLQLTNRDTGMSIGTYTIDGFSSFPTNMNNLGVCWVGHNASSNRTTSNIDNVKFYEK
jgi:hypothetical protein